jgi:prevent-host-death family protein
MTVSKSKFRARALHFFREVEKTHRPIIITDRGKPVLKLAPYSENPKDKLKDLRHTVIKYKNPTEAVELDDWEAPK